MLVKEFTNFDTPDAYVKEAAPTASINGASIGIIGVVSQAIRGPVGVPTLVASLKDYIAKFGGYDNSINDSFMYMVNLFNQSASQVKFVRVTDGNDKAATGSVSGTVFTLDSTGTWGNGVTLTVSNNSIAGYVNLVFAYGSENYTYEQVTFTSATDPQYFVNVINNSGDDFVAVTTAGNTNPASGVYTFAGGTNGTLVGSALTDAAYVGTNTSGGLTGLVAFEADEEAEIIVCGRSTQTINDAINTHINLTTVSPRIGIIALPLGTQVTAVQGIMASYNTDRLVVTYPFLQIRNAYNGNKKELHTATAFYAGVLSNLAYHESPSQQQLNGVIATERPLTRAEVDSLSRTRVSSITVAQGGGFIIRNGKNASSNASLSNTTRRRAMNYFAKTFEKGSLQFTSKPHTVDLRNDIKSAFGSLLQTELSLKRIGNPNTGKAYAVKCDSQNNPNDIVQQNKLIVDVQISLLAPADFILITIDASEAKVISLE